MLQYSGAIKYPIVGNVVRGLIVMLRTPITGPGLLESPCKTAGEKSLMMKLKVFCGTKMQSSHASVLDIGSVGWLGLLIQGREFQTAFKEKVGRQG